MIDFLTFRRRLPARAAGILMPLILSVMMTFIVSAIATLRSVGLTPDVHWVWLGAWGMSWLVAFPTLLLVLPLVRRIVGRLVEPA
jgi:hypothetical protein